MQDTVDAYRQYSLRPALTVYSALFLTMQCCFIPGSFFLAILCGSLLSLPRATALITSLTAVGCSVNYWASHLVFARALSQLCPHPVRRFRQLVAANQEALASCLLFLRVAPMMPSWLINCASPLARVPFSTFLGTTILGFQPQVRLFLLWQRALWRAAPAASSHPFPSWTQAAVVASTRMILAASVRDF